MKSITIAPLALFALTFLTFAAPEGQPSVTGTWNLSVKSDHVIPIGMEITQEGSKIKGTLMLPNGDFDLTGDFDGKVLTVNGTQENAGGEQGKTAKVSFSGTLNEDGTLSGEFKSPHGMMPYTAERLKKRPAAK